MLVCPKCGEENPERARFCLACGTALTAPAGGEARKVVTILFSDVGGVAALGERLDPEALRRVLVRWADAARGVVARHGGTPEKFVGDAIMAVFGVPQVREDDALRAVRAALELRDELARANEELERAHGVRLELSTGVHTGEVVVGAGETFATGDAVNVAARLEQVAAPGEILVGEPTRRLVRDAVAVDAVAPLALKGKSQPLTAWRLVGLLAEPPLGARADSPLVGRERELGLLAAELAAARDGRRCRLVTVSEQAGIGKSRLVRELVASIERDARVLAGRCLAYGENVTFWPLGEIVRDAAEIGADTSAAEGVAAIAALLPDEPDASLVAERLAGAIGLGEAGAPPEEITWAARRLVEALAAERPLVLVLDDVHRAEPTFLDLVEQLAARLEHAPVLLLCLARPELLEQRPDFGEAAGGVRLALDSLSDEASERLIDSRGAGTLDPALRARIRAAADGNPLFVEEMLAMLADADADRDRAEVVVPPTIQALLAARLDRLDASLRALLERASVAGQEFTRRALAALHDGGPVDEPLAELVRRDLVRPARGSYDGGAFRFRHLLIRDAAYAAMPKELRAELHERFAGFLDASGGGELRQFEELVGYHLEQAHRLRTELGPPDERTHALAARAARRLESAARRAYARSDLPAASGLLERALALFEPDAPERPDAQVLLGFALFEHGRLARADEVFAAAEAAGARAPELAARIGRLLVGAQAGDPAFDLPGALATAEAAVPELERVEYATGLGSAWRLIMTLQLLLLRAGAGARAAERAVAQARRAGDVRGEIESLYFFAVAAAVGPTPVADGLARSEELLAAAPGPHATASIETGLAALRAMAGDVDEARVTIRSARATMHELGLALHADAASFVETQVERHAGDLEAAERVLREADASLAALGDVAYRSQGVAVLAGVLADLGRLDEALAAADEASRIDVTPMAKAYWRAGRSRALAALGAEDDAAALAREAAVLLADTDALHVRAELLESLAEVVGGAEGGEALAEALELYELKGCLVCAARLRERAGALEKEARAP